MPFTRRDFLRRGTLFLAMGVTAPTFLTRTAQVLSEEADAWMRALQAQIESSERRVSELSADPSASLAPIAAELRRIESLRPELVEVTSTTGDWPVTVTLSAIDASVSSAFTVAVNPRPTRMPSRTTVLNPVSS